MLTLETPTRRRGCWLCRLLLSGLLAGSVLPAAAQMATVPAVAPADTARRHSGVALDEVVVTATRTERTLAQVPVPLTVVGREQMRAMGAVRLTDVLGEQTGLTVVTDHGRGVQLQGLSPEYTLILLDGEPLIGRTAGTFELGRVAVGNLERVEILRGPASALWGGEALAGVVNLITAAPRPGTTGVGGQLSARYGANRTADLNARLNLRRERLGVQAFVNRFSTGGYTLGDADSGPTVPPYHNHTAQVRLRYQLRPATALLLNVRGFEEAQRATYRFSLNGTETDVRERGLVDDVQLTPSVQHRLGTRTAGPTGRALLTLRTHATRYRTRARYTYAADGSLYDESFFTQTFVRPEAQLDWYVRPGHTLTAGTGHQRETVEATRYAQRQVLTALYGFVQHDWQIGPRLNVLGGLRYDAPRQYARQLNPKLAVRWQARPAVAVRASAGRGFRAPDFRQLYLNFTNPVAGYSVFGSQEVRPRLAELAAQGQLALDPATGQPLISADLLNRAATLRPESSWAANVGVQIDPAPTLHVTANAFRNDLRDLIETTTVARRTNGQSVFSYYNVRRARTEGADLDVAWAARPTLRLSAGYQWLRAVDRDAVAALRAGQVFRRDPATLRTERVPEAAYGGLFNRSRHTANVKVFGEWPRARLDGSVRAIYRGRFGFADRNGNGLLDTDAEYAPGFWLLNATVGRRFGRHLAAQAGCDNLLNYTDAAHLPGQPGRQVWLRLEVSLGTEAAPAG